MVRRYSLKALTQVVYIARSGIFDELETNDVRDTEFLSLGIQNLTCNSEGREDHVTSVNAMMLNSTM